MKKFVILFCFIFLPFNISAHCISIGGGYSLLERKRVIFELSYDSGSIIPVRGNSVVSILYYFNSSQLGIKQVNYSNVRFSTKLCENLFFYSGAGCFLKKDIPTPIANEGWYIPGLCFPFGIIFRINSFVSVALNTSCELGIGIPIYNGALMPFFTPFWDTPFSLLVRFCLGGS